MGIFDRQGASHYAELRNQLTAFLRKYESIRFRYQVVQVSADKGRAFATADVDMDAITVDGAEVPIRRTLQLRFQLKLGPKGWKVIALSPSDFFVL